MPDSIKTICPYCGVGCGLIAETDGNRIGRLRGDPDHPANFGKLCPKGATAAQAVNVPNRLRYAMIRDDRLDEMAICSQQTAALHVARKLEAIIQRHGPGAVAFYLSGQITTESQYLANKFAKGYLRTNHVDSNSRLCMASAASGMKLSLGSDGPPTSYADVDLADAYLFVGSNAAECHPVLFERMMTRVRKGRAKSIVVDPRKTLTAEQAAVHLAVRPGTDLALMNGLLRIVRDAGAIDRQYVAEHTEGWSELDSLLSEYPPDAVAAICGIDVDDLLAAGRILVDSPKLLTFWTMGVNQSVQGTFTTNAIINLHLATGRIGKPGCGPFSLTGQPNAMGGRDCGYMSHTLPGYRLVADAEHRRQMEQLWGLPAGTIRSEPGHDAVAMFDALAREELKAVWIIGSNPAASMPNLKRVREGLAAAELVVVQDAYFPTETTRYAHVVLPAAVNFEQDGTFCNSERRVSLMQRVVPPPGEAMPDWWWIKQVASHMGFTAGLQHRNAADIFDEFSRTTAGRPNDQSAMHHELLKVKGPQQWPYPSMGRSSERRFVDGVFATPSGKAQLLARPHELTSERTSGEFPLILTTGRVLNQWHTRTKTGQVDQLNKLDPAPYLQIHPENAQSLGIADGQKVVIQSQRGKCFCTARLDVQIAAGTVFMPIHWNDLFAPAASPNEATTDVCDPVSKQPALKCCAVAVLPADAPQLASSLPVHSSRLEAVELLPMGGAELFPVPSFSALSGRELGD
jgi:anaerobic selenocysteine-containing dehydrogenase